MSVASCIAPTVLNYQVISFECFFHAAKVVKEFEARKYSRVILSTFLLAKKLINYMLELLA